MTATLNSTSRKGLTAREAIAWWRSGPTDPDGPDQAVGFAVSAQTAVWWRLDDGLPTTSAGQEADLATVYELVGFDGHLELRWRNDTGGRGLAVVLGEEPETLPAGGKPAVAAATRLPDPQERILAGQVSPHGADGWFRLTAARYAPAHVPVALTTGVDLAGREADTPVVVLESVEYAVEDRHGNLSVVDRRLTRLRLRRHRDLRYDPREG